LSRSIISDKYYILGLALSQMDGWVKEHKFHPAKKWRLDYANPGIKLAIEIEGGIWTLGRHTRGSGFKADMEKYNAASILGWGLLRYDSGTATDQKKGIIRIIEDVNNFIKIRGTK
jgi:hypothetical protein